MYSPYGAQIDSLTKISKPKKDMVGVDKSSGGFKASVVGIGGLLQYIAGTPENKIQYLHEAKDN